MKIKNENIKLVINSGFNAEKDKLYLDSFLFTSVLFNILDNAIKYNANSPELILTTKNEKKSFVLQVTDNGIGISKEDHKLIFDKFYRAANCDVQKTKGLGIGLYTAKMIIKAHGGSISVSSKQNQGSIFKIVLPIAGWNDGWKKE
jgi:two-component system phosphate regulon sensor histidine kinase PhoR